MSSEGNILPNEQLIALVSGGKDSIFTLHLCIQNFGLVPVALAHLAPITASETDSYMYQSVASQLIDILGQALDLPTYVAFVTGAPINQQLEYSQTRGDEVEDMFLLLQKILAAHPQARYLCVGAVKSQYQRNRVLNVCQRLNLIMVTPLWGKPEEEILMSMASANLEAVIVKVAAWGLGADLIGKDVIGLFQSGRLYELAEKYGANLCGEGGEYETFTLASPLHHRRIVLDEWELVCLDSNIVAPVYCMRPVVWHTEPL